MSRTHFWIFQTWNKNKNLEHQKRLEKILYKMTKILGMKIFNIYLNLEVALKQEENKSH